MSAKIFDPRRCQLGEGPLWHPISERLYWFDILDRSLLSLDAGEPRRWRFDECVSAAGWLDENLLLIASESGLYRFDLRDSTRELVVALERDNPLTRSNDGRADPWGGFWIGTMGKNAEPDAGAIYRYYRGELRCLYEKITISNSICFAADAGHAFFCDSESGIIMRQPLTDNDGWPVGPAQSWLDLRGEPLAPDGSVVDADNHLWNAQWGAARVACYSPSGILVRTVEMPTAQISCPAFGGTDMTTLYATSANDGMQNPDDGAGQTFSIDLEIKGQTENQVIL